MVDRMEIVDEKMHVVLTYIDAVSRAGVHLSSEALQAFAKHPAPMPGKKVSIWDQMTSVSLGTTWRAGEAEVAFLLRAQWIDSGPNGVRLTALGKAVLAHADRPKLATTAGQPLAVTIDPDDPLAYLRVFDVIGDAGSGLLVDPYIRFPELADVIELAAVDRVLTSDRTDRDGNRLRALARTLTTLESDLEVRSLDRAELHDRFFIADQGSVYSLGSSLNSITARPGVVTPIADPAAAQAIRSIYAEMWARSVVLDPPVQVSVESAGS